MSSSTPGNDVEVEGRFVLFEVGRNDPPEKISNRFIVGTCMWTWQLSVIRLHRRQKNAYMRICLHPPDSKYGAASVSLKVICLSENQLAVVHNFPEVHDVSHDHPHTWTVRDACISTRSLLEIKFDNIKSFGTPIRMYLSRSSPMREMSWEQAQSGFASMLRQDILTDVTVNAVGGSIKVHRAVLAARSPVFLSMFTHDFREKELSTVDIPDMSIDVCRVFMGYLYGAGPSEEKLLAHRCELVAASDKYDVMNLKETCEKSMRDDVCTENVLERLQVAHTYGLPALKKTCVRLLVDFGKMYQIREDFEQFMESGDQELVREIKRIAVSRGRKFPAAQKPTSAGKVSAKKAWR